MLTIIIYVYLSPYNNIKSPGEILSHSDVPATQSFINNYDQKNEVIESIIQSNVKTAIRDHYTEKVAVPEGVFGNFWQSLACPQASISYPASRHLYNQHFKQKQCT